MAFSRLIKLPQYRRFNFPARYYNADKEEFEKRVEKSKREAIASNQKEYTPNIKGQMRGYFLRDAARQSRNSNIRLFVIIAALSLLAYFILVSDFEFLSVLKHLNK